MHHPHVMTKTKRKTSGIRNTSSKREGNESNQNLNNKIKKMKIKTKKNKKTKQKRTDKN